MANIEDSRTQRLLDNLAMKTSQPKAMDQNKEIRREDVGSTEFMVREKNIGIINFDNVKTQLRKAKTQDVVREMVSIIIISKQGITFPKLEYEV